MEFLGGVVLVAFIVFIGYRIYQSKKSNNGSKDGFSGSRFNRNTRNK